MPLPIELALHEIIVKSQQLLLKLDDFSSDEALANDLIKVQVEREQLLHNLFSNFSKDDIQVFHPLVNQLLQLDIALIDKSVQFKQDFSMQLIQVHKGKKSTKAYQKY